VENMRPSVPRTVLVVDDEMDAADALATLLTEFGFAVQLAHSARAALDLLESGIKPDAVVSDILFADGMNGLQFARTLRAHWPKLPVLLATGFDFAADVARLRGVRTLVKPFLGAQIAAVLDEIIVAAPPGAQQSVA
jgi:CheY-like chemotaxis protein